MALKTFPGTTHSEKAELSKIFGLAQDSKPTDEELRIQNQIRDLIHETAQTLDVHVEDGREKSWVISHLEEALMWANKAIFKAPETF